MPVNLLRCSQIRKLVLRLGGPGGELYAIKLWFEFAEARETFRVVPCTRAEEAAVVHMIEQYCGWNGQVGGLVQAALESGLLAWEFRGNDRGIVFPLFAQLNPHLDPDHRSRQRKGGAATSVRRGRKDSDAFAADLVRVARSIDQELPLSHASASADEAKAAMSLLMQLDRACGLPQRGNLKDDFSDDEELLLAVEALRSTNEEEVMAVLEFIVLGRSDPTVVKSTKRCLLGWAELKVRAIQ